MTELEKTRNETAHRHPRFLPDGVHFLYHVTSAKPEYSGIYLGSLNAKESKRLVASATKAEFAPPDRLVDNVPVWSPDGTEIAFVSNRKGGVFNLYLKSANLTGDDRLLLETSNNKTINDWSADGRYILYEEEDPKTKTDLWVLPLFGDRKPVRVVSTPFVEYRASFSPDGRWIAYTSNESGRVQLYVQGFPKPEGKWQISTGETGIFPRWRPDGKELFYDAAGPLMAVDVSVAGREFKAGTPRRVLTGLLAGMVHNYDVTPDGKRFLLDTMQAATTGPTPIVVVVNWKTGVVR